MKKKKIIIIGIVSVFLLAGAFVALDRTTIERTIEYDGGTYTGDTGFFDRIPDGNGTIEYPNGTTYAGEWLEGVRTGYGESKGPVGSSYKGMWLDNEYEGEGTYTAIDGYTESGNFVGGELESGEISDYYVVFDRQKLSFTREVSGFKSHIVDVEDINGTDQLAEIIAANMASGDMAFIAEVDSSYVSDLNSILDTLADRRSLYAEIDECLYREYGLLMNVGSIELTRHGADGTTVFETSRRDVLTRSQSGELTAKIREIISDNITDDMSTFNKIKTLHDYLVENITYDDSYENCRNAYGALIEGEAVCEGYTEALSMLLDEVGISNYMVSGDDLDTEDNMVHIWNLVEFDDGFYHVDVTWDDPDHGKRKIYDYFGLSDREIQKTHTVFRKDVPESGNVTNMYLKYYSERGLNTYIYFDNATYYGQINISGDFNGYGTLSWFDGDKYSGSFVNGVRDGNGRYEFSDGDVYEGSFVNGQIQGYGTYTWANGNSKSQVW